MAFPGGNQNQLPPIVPQVQQRRIIVMDPRFGWINGQTEIAIMDIPNATITSVPILDLSNFRFYNNYQVPVHAAGVLSSSLHPQPVPQWQGLQQSTLSAAAVPLTTGSEKLVNDESEFPSADPDCEKYSIKIGKSPFPVSIMRFLDRNINPEDWAKCRMTRCLSASPAPTPGKLKEKVNSKLETGSELTRNWLIKREERRKKLGRRTKPIKDEDKPWLMKLSTKTEGEARTKVMKGVKEGGLTENSSYFIFVEQNIGLEKVYEAFQVKDLFDFRAVNNYKSLTAEEAEERFRKRNETYNYFSLMTGKRLGMEGTSSEEENYSNTSSTRAKRKDMADSCSDTSDDDVDGNPRGSKRSKKNGKSNCLINSHVDDEDNDDENVEFMSSSDCTSSDSDSTNNETETEGGDDDNDTTPA